MKLKNTIVVMVLAAVMLVISTKGFADTYTDNVKEDLMIAYVSYYIIKECNAAGPVSTGTYDEDVETAKILVKAIEAELVTQERLDTDAIWNEVVNDPDVQSFVNMLSLAKLGEGSLLDMPICIDEYGPHLVKIAQAHGIMHKMNEKDF